MTVTGMSLAGLGRTAEESLAKQPWKRSGVRGAAEPATISQAMPGSWAVVLGRQKKAWASGEASSVQT